MSLADSNQVDQALSILEEIENAQLHNSEDYLLEVSCILRSQLIEDPGIKKNLKEKADYYCSEFAIREWAKDQSNLFMPELLDFES